MIDLIRIVTRPLRDAPVTARAPQSPGLDGEPASVLADASGGRSARQLLQVVAEAPLAELPDRLLPFAGAAGLPGASENYVEVLARRGHIPTVRLLGSPVGEIVP